MIRYHTIVLVLAVLVMAGVSTSAAATNKGNKIPDTAREILEKANQFELLSIHPDRPQKKSRDGLHGWRVLGRTAVKYAEARKKLVAAFKKSVEENDGRAAACFNPRHAIQATHDGKTADFVICFECYQARVYVDGVGRQGFLITHSPEPVFDKVLTDAKVPLAQKPKKM